ncbi:hypothetical protein PZA11_000513 [Diplocarpon coronariae]
MSVMILTFSIRQTAGPIIAVSKSAAAATDFFAIIDTPKPSTSDSPLPKKIVFDSVTFFYLSRTHGKVLDNSNIEVESGKITAIFGTSGSGKCTIVGLLERWYEVNGEKRCLLLEIAVNDDKAEKEKTKTKDNGSETKDDEAKAAATTITLSGSIRVGEHSFEAISLQWLWSQIGLFGSIGAQWEDANVDTKKYLVEHACKEAFADEYFVRLPNGYDTQIGDADIKLSGEQRQRLVIARSIIKRSKIHILDEATSSIDVQGERLAQAALDKVSEGRTTIKITHQLSTIKRADKIILLKKGRLVGQGTHNKESDLIELSEEPTVGFASAASGEAKATEVEEQAWKAKGFLNSFGLLLCEQRSYWPWYLLLLASVGDGYSNPIQAILWAKILLNTFTGVALAQC